MTREIRFSLPQWAADVAAAATSLFDVDERMRFVIAASRRNIAERTGGPFGAAIFERDSGRLVALGVNIVEARGLSILHAEIVAIALAQNALGGYDLSARGHHDLISSAEPCAMCFGAVGWSGVSRLVVGARREDVERAGFDEGAKPENWPDELLLRGIETIRDVERAEAAQVLADYAKAGGLIYNAGLTGR